MRWFAIITVPVEGLTENRELLISDRFPTAVYSRSLRFRIFCSRPQESKASAIMLRFWMAEWLRCAMTSEVHLRPINNPLDIEF